MHAFSYLTICYFVIAVSSFTGHLYYAKNMQKLLNKACTEKCTIQNYAVRETGKVLKIVNTGFNKIPSSYSISSTLLYFKFLYI